MQSYNNQFHSLGKGEVGGSIPLGSTSFYHGKQPYNQFSDKIGKLPSRQILAEPSQNTASPGVQNPCSLFSNEETREVSRNALWKGFGNAKMPQLGAQVLGALMDVISDTGGVAREMKRMGDGM